MLWVAYACGRPPSYPGIQRKAHPVGARDARLVHRIRPRSRRGRPTDGRQTASKWLRRSRSGEGSPTKAAARAGIRGPRRQDGTTSYLAIRCLERLRGTAASNSIHLVAPT